MAKYLNNRVKNLKVGVAGKTDSENVLEVSGNISATKFVGDGSGLTAVVADQAGILLQNNDSDVGTATTINFSTGIEVSTVSSGFATVTVPDVGFFSSNDTGIHTTGNIGIGTTTADGAADENNTTILNAGIVTAVNYYGKGVGLTSIVDATDGTYGSESAIPAFTITDGRITSITTNNVSAGGDGGQNSLIYISNNDSALGSAGTINFGLGINASSPVQGVVTVTTSPSFFVSNDTGIHTTGNVGIGTTTADGAADENNTTVLNAGIVTANYFYGDATGLTSLTSASADTYGSSNYAPVITVDANGRITGITTAAISGSGAIATIEEDTNPSLGNTLNAVGYGISNVGILTANHISISGISTFLGNVGIGTTNAASDSAADPNNTTVLNAGIVTANYFYGNGAGLTGLDGAQFDAVSQDTDPELGGDLDLNNREITGIGTINITGSLGGDFLSAPHGSTVTLAVTVSSKTSAHRYPSGVNGASGNAYYIDGIEAPFLTLTPGRTYRFDQSDTTNGGHPLQFYLEADKTTKYTTNVTTSGTPGTDGYTEITVTDETPIVLHYQCESHDYMGNGSQTNSNYIKTTYDSVFLGNVGIGTTNAASDSAADSNNTTVLNAGIVTAREYYGNNINITGVSTLTTLKVGTGITAEAGVITATSFSFSNSATLTSSNSFVLADDSGTPEIRADELSITAADGTTRKMFFAGSGSSHAVRLHCDGSEKLTTATNGIYVQGTVGSNGGANITGVVTATSFSGDGANITNVTSANATNASNIDLSDESTDTICYPIFATNATGNQAPKTDASNLLYNSSTGRLTAASFAGDGSSLTNVASIPGTFDENIEESRYISVNSGIGTNTDETNDIFVGPGTSFAFPSTAGRRYIIESIQITNKFSSDLYLSGRIDFDGASDVPLAQRVIIPYQGSVEYLTKPLVVNPSDVLRLQSLAGVGTTASGISGGLDAFVTYTEKSNEDFVGIGTTAPSTSAVTVYESVTYPTVLESIKVSNYNLNFDIDASISIANVNTIGYLVYNLTIPKNTTIEIIEKPKHLATGHKIVAKSNTANSLAVIVSGKKIT